MIGIFHSSHPVTRILVGLVLRIGVTVFLLFFNHVWNLIGLILIGIGNDYFSIYTIYVKYTYLIKALPYKSKNSSTLYSKFSWVSWIMCRNSKARHNNYLWVSWKYIYNFVGWQLVSEFMLMSVRVFRMCLISHVPVRRIFSF